MVYKHIDDTLGSLSQSSEIPFGEFSEVHRTSLTYESMCSTLGSIIDKGADQFSKLDWQELKAHEKDFNEASSDAGRPFLSACLTLQLKSRQSRLDKLDYFRSPVGAEMWVSDVCNIISGVLDTRKAGSRPGVSDAHSVG